MAVPGEELAARLRAARAYADLRQADLADLLGESLTTYKRMERDGRNLDSEDRLRAVARRCGIPEAFMLAGWGPLARPLSDAERRLVAVEDQLQRLLALEDAVGELRGLQAVEAARRIGEAGAAGPSAADPGPEGHRGPIREGGSL
jgi:transcriptional regulator with XRE-family HTH domain